MTAADDGNQSESTSNLVQLLCAMQRSLLTWCSTQMKSGSSFGQNVATDLIIECKFYMSRLSSACCSEYCTRLLNDVQFGKIIWFDAFVEVSSYILCFVVLDVGILANRVFMSLQAVNDASDQLVVIDRLEHSYVAAAMRQLVSFVWVSYCHRSLGIELRFHIT